MQPLRHHSFSHSHPLCHQTSMPDVITKESHECSPRGLHHDCQSTANSGRRGARSTYSRAESVPPAITTCRLQPSSTTYLNLLTASTREGKMERSLLSPSLPSAEAPASGSDSGRAENVVGEEALQLQSRTPLEAPKRE